eukprot:553858-Rhodomonas_salina.2
MRLEMRVDSAGKVVSFQIRESEDAARERRVGVRDLVKLSMEPCACGAARPCVSEPYATKPLTLSTRPPLHASTHLRFNGSRLLHCSTVRPFKSVQPLKSATPQRFHA